ncbi:MAG: hypothetical protein K0S22_78 [Oscillospiraceae bacterium]|jgi:hypothetical protein|nr:hypothetical protein [Oscillospiraceae bacterium]
MRFQAIKVRYWLPIFLVAVGALGYLALKPSAELTGASLESAGYSLSSLETAQFENPCPAHAQYPLSLFVQEGDQKRRYAKNLVGSYTVVSAPMPYYDTAELVSLMWLQAVRTADIHGVNPTLETADGPVSLRQLSKHQVYRDKDIVVFDVTAIERSENIEAVTINFATECTERSQAFLNATDIPPGRNKPSKPMLAVLDGTYRFDVITDMNRYLQENLTQSILPALTSQ